MFGRKVSCEELSEAVGIVLQPSPLLEQCFVHKSACNENPEIQSYERLEFLGDSIVGRVVAEWLFVHYPDCQEGDLSKMKAAVVSEPSLAAAALRLGLNNFVVGADLEKDTGLKDRPSILCDIFEALTAAIYISSGSGAAEEFVLTSLHDILLDIINRMSEIDPKTNLQKIIQEVFRTAPNYVLISEIGQSHDKTFTFSVNADDIYLAEGTGKSKKEAEKNAAAAALVLIRSVFDNVYDVGVIGAGLAGVSAAAAAAREGASVVICDKFAAPGGLATYGLVNPFMTHCTADGKPLVGGLFEEIKSRLDKKGYLRNNCFDSEGMKEVLISMLSEEDKIEFRKADGFVSARRISDDLFFVVLEKSFFVCRRAVDASGDGVCARSLGARAQLGDDNGRLQAVSLMFDVAGVNIRSAMKYAVSHPDDFLFPKHSPETDIEAACMRNYSHAGFFSLIRKAKEEKGYDFPGDMIFYIYRKSQGGRYDTVTFNQTHAAISDPESEFEKQTAAAECERQLKQVLALIREYIPGFEKAYLLRKADMLGIRESYRIMGDYIFSDVDVAKAAKHRDRVCCLSYPVDVHSPDGEGYTIKESTKACARPPKGDWYEIPYRCLTAKEVPGLLVCGKIISATHEGMGASRIMPCAAATGQAAGAAAALSVKYNVSPDKLEYTILKPSLALL